MADGHGWKLTGVPLELFNKHSRAILKKKDYFCARCNKVPSNTMWIGCGHYMCESCAEIVKRRLKGDRACPRCASKKKIESDIDFTKVLRDPRTQRCISQLNLVMCPLGCALKDLSFRELDEHLDYHCKRRPEAPAVKPRPRIAIPRDDVSAINDGHIDSEDLSCLLEKLMKNLDTGKADGDASGFAAQPLPVNAAGEPGHVSSSTAHVMNLEPIIACLTQAIDNKAFVTKAQAAKEEKNVDDTEAGLKRIEGQEMNTATQKEFLAEFKSIDPTRKAVKAETKKIAEVKASAEELGAAISGVKKTVDRHEDLFLQQEEVLQAVKVQRALTAAPLGGAESAVSPQDITLSSPGADNFTMSSAGTCSADNSVKEQFAMQQKNNAGVQTLFQEIGGMRSDLKLLKERIQKEEEAKQQMRNAGAMLGVQTLFQEIEGMGSDLKLLKECKDVYANNPGNADSDSDLSDDLDFLDDCDDSRDLINLRVIPCRRTRIRDLFTSESVYKMSGPIRGRCLIMNNNIFDQNNPRHGSERDVENLRRVFGRLSFEVDVKIDLSIQEMMMAVMEETKHRYHAHHGMFVLVIMSHGAENTVCGRDGLPLSLSTIYDLLSSSKFTAMAGKPKVIIIQACSGGRTDTKGGMVTDADVPVSQPSTPSAPPPPPGDSVTAAPQPGELLDTDDFYIMKASFPGYVSGRHARMGSWFIRAFVEALYKHACHRDLESLFKQVQKKVRKKSLNTTYFSGQQPTDQCTFAYGRKLYLFPCYDPPP